MYDVIVAGARCAGAPTAMLLARKGYKVLLVDRDTFPSDIPHGHVIHRGGPACLQRWGLLERVVATNCPPITSMLLDLGDFPLVGRDLIAGGAAEGVAFACAPRRMALDKVLADAAVQAGVELREGFVVDEYVGDGDRITGIRGWERHARTAVTEQATITIGADGRNSRLAKAVRAPVYESAPVATCTYFSYWSGVPADALEVYVRRNRYVVVFPTNDRLIGVGVGWPAAELPVVRTDIEGQFMAVLDQVPDLAARVRGGRREERFTGASDLPNFYRKPFGPGWALVGDAGCHKDPYLALGICDAFRDAEWLAEAVDDGLSGRCALDTALAEFERRRNEAGMRDYHENLTGAQFQPPPAEQMQLRAALRDSPEDTRGFFMAVEGMIPPEKFFNPQNMGRIMAHAAVGA
jgi:flavin-dependent dehydrogenase